MRPFESECNFFRFHTSGTGFFHRTPDTSGIQLILQPPEFFRETHKSADDTKCEYFKNKKKQKKSVINNLSFLTVADRFISIIYRQFTINYILHDRSKLYQAACFVKDK